MPHVSVCVGMDRWVVEGACIPRNHKNKMLRVPGEKNTHRKKRAMPFLHLPSASDAPLCTCRRRRLTSVAPGAPGLTLTVECKLVEEGAPPAGGDGGQRHRRCGGGARGTNPPTNGLPYGPSHLWLRCGSFASFLRKHTAMESNGNKCIFLRKYFWIYDEICITHGARLCVASSHLNPVIILNPVMSMSWRLLRFLKTEDVTGNSIGKLQKRSQQNDERRYVAQEFVDQMHTDAGLRLSVFFCAKTDLVVYMWFKILKSIKNVVGTFRFFKRKKYSQNILCTSTSPITAKSNCCMRPTSSAGGLGHFLQALAILLGLMCRKNQASSGIYPGDFFTFSVSVDQWTRTQGHWPRRREATKRPTRGGETPLGR